MRKIITIIALTITVMANAQENKHIEVKQTAGRAQLGDFAPEFARFNDDVLFGEVWNRNNKLSLRDRSLVTVVSLMSQGLTDSSFKYHLMEAKKNGITREELAEILPHDAFYAGWPKAWAAFRMAKEVWIGETDDTNAAMSKELYGQSIMFPIGAPNDAYAKYFVGQSYLAPVNAEGIGIANVTFEPGCRNNWHIHHGAVQVLICVAGRGWYQKWGKDAIELKPGVVVAIPEGVKHWHGATADSWMQHLTYETKVEAEHSNEWLEPVNADEYNKLK